MAAPEQPAQPAAARPESAPSRIEWVDVGRGLAIVLVVLYHAARWLDRAGPDTDGWQQVNATLASLQIRCSSPWPACSPTRGSGSAPGVR